MYHLADQYEYEKKRSSPITTLPTLNFLSFFLETYFQVNLIFTVF